MEPDRPPHGATFHLFSRLPTELRLKIWKYSLPGVRIVPVHCAIKSPSFHEPQEPDDSARPACRTSCTTTALVPANLHACTEARTEAEKHYRCCLGYGRQPGHIHFNATRDILYFGPRPGYMAADAQFRTCMAMCDPSELASVRRLAINDALFWIDDKYRSMTAASLTLDLVDIVSTRMPHLEELLFVPRQEDGEPQYNLMAVQQRMQYQIATAMYTLRQQNPKRRLPAWRVISLPELLGAQG